jgi:hypothetical protein
VRPGLNHLDIALAGNCDFGGPHLYLGPLRHRNVSSCFEPAW